MAHVVYADAVSVVSDWRNLKAKSIKIQERSRLSRKNEFSADNAKFYKIPRVVKLWIRLVPNNNNKNNKQICWAPYAKLPRRRTQSIWRDKNSY